MTYRPRRAAPRRTASLWVRAAAAGIAASLAAVGCVKLASVTSGDASSAVISGHSTLHTARDTSPDSPSPGASASPDGSGSARNLIPSSGAYLGAYVEPTEYTPPAEIAAVQSFQRSVHGPISIVHVYHPWDSPFPNLADRHFVRHGKVLLLTWGGTPDTRKIIAGDYDSKIRSRAEAVKRLGRPILMEFRHEMDRPNLQWAVHGPKAYIAAWDHIRAIFTQAGATNVGWVWCPTGYGFGKGRAQAFYPGNSEVDWVCADIYSPSAGQSLQQAAQPFLAWAKHTHKPVMIGEFGVDSAPADWPDWLLAAGELAKTDRQIKAMLYFDANGTDSNGHPFQYWLGNDPPALAVFAELLTWRVFHPVLP
jgi:Glycosyl hydrolase family 26